MYQVLARKWRPQRFDELVGQEPVARTLANAIDSDRLAHAYIFAGLRGTGKTTVARILAKCLNCEQGPTKSPCGQCVACEEIAASRAMDVMEIDAASRTKVEQTREMLELVSYAPVRDRYKILIIDEAHMLSKSSFNALLKTLEEPPPNVVFVLATTELHKVLPTIVSRCQVFEFRRVSPTEVAAHLRRICDENGVQISDAALERVARAGEGSVRDSLSLLERVLAFCGEVVDDEDVLRMLGAVRAQVLVEIVAALSARDAAGMLDVLDKLVDEGHDLVHFWNELIAALRDLLVMDSLPGRHELLSRPADEAAALEQAAGELGREDLSRAFQILADLEPGLKNSSQPRYLFEAALIRLASLGAVRPIEELLAGMPADATAPPRRSAPAASQKKNSAERAVLAKATAPSTVREPDPRHPPERTTSPQADSDAFVDAVRQARPMLAAMLAQASVRLADDGLVLGFPDEMDAVRKQCERSDSIALLRETAEKLWGGSVGVRFESKDAERPAPAAPRTRALPAAKPRGRAAARSTESPKPRTPPPKDAGLMERACSEPGVRKLLDAFGAQVLEIGPLDVPGEAVADPDSMEDNR